MNIAQENVLKKLVSSFNETGVNSFDTTSFTALENACLKELQKMGYIVISRDILQTVSLSDKLLSLISKTNE